MQCTADPDSEESQEPVVPHSPSHFFLHKVDLRTPTPKYLPVAKLDTKLNFIVMLSLSDSTLREELG